MRNGLSYGKIMEIISVYEEVKTASKTSRITNTDVRTVLKYADIFGLEIKHQYRKRPTPKDEEEMVLAWKSYGKNSAEASKHLPWSAPTQRKYWRKNGLEPGRAHKSKNLEKISSED